MGARSIQLVNRSDSPFGIGNATETSNFQQTAKTDSAILYGRNGRIVDFDGLSALEYIAKWNGQARAGNMEAVYKMYQAESVCANNDDPVAEYKNTIERDQFLSERKALKKICDKGIILENGMLVHSGSIEDSIDIYNRGTKEISIDKIAFKSTDVRINVDTILVNGLTNNHIKLESDAVLYISIIGTAQEDLPIEMQANLFDDEEYPLAFYSPGHVSGVTKKITKGDFQLDYTINLPQNMNSGIFHLKIGLSDPGHHFYGETSNQIVITFDGITIKSGLVFNAKKNGWLLIN